MKELKEYIKILVQNNKELVLLNKQKNQIIKDLTEQLQVVKSDLEYSSINGGIKKLIYKRHNFFIR